MSQVYPLHPYDQVFIGRPLLRTVDAGVNAPEEIVRHRRSDLSGFVEYGP